VSARRVVTPMKNAIALVLAALALASSASGEEPIPFKVGTFERAGKRFVGIVVKDSLVVDLAAADAMLPGTKLTTPIVDMKDAIERYRTELRPRIGAILEQMLRRPLDPPLLTELASNKTLPPILYPTTMLNVAVNYREHGREMAGRTVNPSGSPEPGAASPGTASIPGIWERRPDDTRWNPYMFVKLPSAVIATGEAIRIPEGRAQIDWECELGVVIGREARRVEAAHAADYIFGYTLENDVSDRGGRGDSRHGSDWLVAKSHDTFAPLGPFVVPKEFVKDPQQLQIRFTLNGQLMQDATTASMIHDVYELVVYASHITTLRPGDVIATGTPPGVGSGRTPPVFLKPGDQTTCSYEGIGTLANPVAAAAR
jgi:2-keto-4-pentenoate hydratase/2-oxohepta-3-ene-1,7-dioic acid hydratase in catechol pathway